jgi:hypothetical protein
MLARLWSYLRRVLTDEHSHIGRRGVGSRAHSAHPLAPQVKIHPAPSDADLDLVLSQPVSPLLITGIINPFGPTITAFVIAGDLEASARLPIVRLVLHPFQPSVESVGEVTLGEAGGFPSAAIRPILSLISGSCPTLMLCHRGLPGDFVVQLYSDCLGRFPDRGVVLDRVREYYGDPWSRVSAEVQSGIERIARRTQAATHDSAPRPLDAGSSDELAELLMSDEHTGPELQACADAWRGAIENRPTDRSAVSLQAFQRIFAHVASNCRLPPS